MLKLKDASRNDFHLWKSFELDYEQKLLKVSREINKILVSAKNEQTLMAAHRRLKEYAELLKPWADIQAANMVQRIYEANERIWGMYAKRVKINLSYYVTQGDLAPVLEKMKYEASGYIQSLSNKAAEDAVNIAQDAMMNGLRPAQIEDEIYKLGDITKNRARLIARTEVARSNSMLIQARAESIGCQAYIWQTAEDARVRESHLEMNGKVCYWNDPPTLSDDTTTHPGQIYNCRCVPLPLLSEGELNEALEAQDKVA